MSEVRAYWDALRDGRQVPFRSEIDPRGIERSLEHAFILERIAPQVARFRLAGQHLSDLMGMEVRGMPFTSFFVPGARSEVSAALEQVFDGPKILDLDLCGPADLGRPPIDARVVILPLRSDLGDVSRALGCFVAEGRMGRAPRRFSLAQTVLTPVDGQPGLRVPQAAAPMPGFAEAATPFAPARPGQTQPRDRSHLRLVISDK